MYQFVITDVYVSEVLAQVAEWIRTKTEVELILLRLSLS